MAGREVIDNSSPALSWRRLRPVHLRHWLPRAVGVACLVGGAALFAHAGYLQAKAWLAQYLIADAWHETLAGGRHVRPWPWADTWPVARLTTPDGDNLYVLEGFTGQALAFGPAWLPASRMAGQGGAMVIAGHKDSHFAFLEHVKRNDIFTVQTADGALHRYRVSSFRIADSRTAQLPMDAHHDELVLVTCYPFGAFHYGSPYRYIVRAQRL